MGFRELNPEEKTWLDRLTMARAVLARAELSAHRARERLKLSSATLERLLTDADFRSEPERIRTVILADVYRDHADDHEVIARAQPILMDGPSWVSTAHAALLRGGDQ